VQNDFNASKPKKEQKKRNRIPFRLLIAVALFILAGWLFLCVYLFKADVVTVKGNDVLSDSYVISQVFPETDDRRLYRILIELLKKIPDNELFTDTHIRVTGKDSVEISIQEVPVCCRMAVGGHVLVFNENGYVSAILETASIPGVWDTAPIVTGLDFTAYTLYEFPETEHPEQLLEALSVVKTVQEQDFSCKEISCRDGQYRLIMDRVTLSLGTAEHLQEKLAEAACQIPYFGDLKGTMHLENCDGSGGQTFYFETEQ